MTHSKCYILLLFLRYVYWDSPRSPIRVILLPLGRGSLNEIIANEYPERVWDAHQQHLKFECKSQHTRPFWVQFRRSNFEAFDIILTGLAISLTVATDCSILSGTVHSVLPCLKQV